MERLSPDEMPHSWVEKVLAQPIPWDKAQSIPMPLFLEQYTVHDSYWLRFWIGTLGEGIALLWWDTFWTRGRIPYPREDRIPWPLLAVRFRQMYEVSWSGMHTMMARCISWAESRSALPEEIQRVKDSFGVQRRPTDEELRQLTEVGIYCTDFLPCLAGDPSILRIIHGGNVELLCLGYNGDLIPIPITDSL